MYNPEQLHVVLFWQSAYESQSELVQSKCVTAVGLSLLASSDAGNHEASNTCLFYTKSMQRWSVLPSFLLIICYSLSGSAHTFI